MKKAGWIVAILLTVTIALTAVGLAFAQRADPSNPSTSPFGGGMMGRRGGYGPMHEYMEEALADALGLTHTEFEERLAKGETPRTIAQEKGLSAEEFRTLMIEARNKALEAMVKDGVITQAQADWMKDHMRTGLEKGFGTGYGNCPMGNNNNSGRRGFGGRWNQNP